MAQRPSKIKGLNIGVFGRVQGVFFRHHTKQMADSLGLSGWVKNEIDDTVLIFAEGPEDKLLELISWCQKGSPRAVVEKVAIEWQNPTREYHDFQVK